MISSEASRKGAENSASDIHHRARRAHREKHQKQKTASQPDQIKLSELCDLCGKKEISLERFRRQAGEWTTGSTRKR